MSELLSAVILGLVQGLTEFLPISSSGHLILTSALMNLDGQTIKTFEVFIQLGSILAVVALFWPRFWGLLVPDKGRKFSGPYGIMLLFITCLPAGILGFFAHGFIMEHLFRPLPVALSLAVGAVLMLVLEKKKPAPRYTGLDEVTPKMALGVGLCQCFSLWPGFSRSASTIMGGMIMGAERRLAAEYSFMAAVPIMFAATAYELYKNFNAIPADKFMFFAVGFVVSFISAWVAIKFFIKMVAKIGLAPFAWYRLAISPLVFWFFS